MKTVHFTHPYLLNPQHEVTVALIGAGGTGSQALTCLARMNAALKALNHPGLFVTTYDPDVVSTANHGRQLFMESDTGLNKAECLTTRINRFFGTCWEGIAGSYDGTPTNIIITCTDNIASRLYVEQVMSENKETQTRPYLKKLYWLDFGNTRSSGQAILGSIQIKQPKSQKYRTAGWLPFVTKQFDYSQINEEDSGPSCSLADALNKQDLFINSTLAQLGCGLLWKLFREGLIEYRGLFLNMDTMKVNSVSIDHEQQSESETQIC